jgi:hypothetical protein
MTVRLEPSTDQDEPFVSQVQAISYEFISSDVVDTDSPGNSGRFSECPGNSQARDISIDEFGSFLSPQSLGNLRLLIVLVRFTMNVVASVQGMRQRAGE